MFQLAGSSSATQMFLLAGSSSATMFSSLELNIIGVWWEVVSAVTSYYFATPSQVGTGRHRVRAHASQEWSVGREPCHFTYYQREILLSLFPLTLCMVLNTHLTCVCVCVCVLTSLFEYCIYYQGWSRYCRLCSLMKWVEEEDVCVCCRDITLIWVHWSDRGK